VSRCFAARTDDLADSHFKFIGRPASQEDLITFACEAPGVGCAETSAYTGADYQSAPRTLGHVFLPYER
jgi:hypothetical protein